MHHWILFKNVWSLAGKSSGNNFFAYLQSITMNFMSLVEKTSTHEVKKFFISASVPNALCKTKDYVEC